MLSRQPICRTDRTIHAYELLFRDNDADYASFRDDDQATVQVIVSAFMEIGLAELVGPHLAFINVSPNFLLSDFCEALPPDRVMLEMLQPVSLDPRLLLRIKLLVREGYKLVLGDFAFAPRFRPLLEQACVVKVDIINNSRMALEEMMAASQGLGLKTVAERVETLEQFTLASTLGFDWFQGYFFCCPEPIRSTRLPLSRLMTMRLIAKLNDSTLTINQLEEAIRQDLSLSYKLLRYVGSAACGVRGQVQSIRHAAVLIGIDRLKIWAALILFSGIEEKMKEMNVTAIIRARMCENLADAMKLSEASERFFLVGLFSLLDAMLVRPMEQILESLNLAPEINQALIRHEGALGSVLECVIAYERRDWKNVRCGSLDQETIRTAYIKAMAWSIRTLNEFSGVVAGDAAESDSRRFGR